jgi:hypothetical protein
METQCSRPSDSIDSAYRSGHFRHHDLFVHRHSPFPTVPQVARGATTDMAERPPDRHRRHSTAVRDADTVQHICITGPGIVTHRHGSRRRNGGAWASRASLSAIARSRDSRETWFGHAPGGADRQAEPRHPPLERARSAANGAARMSWFDAMTAALWRRCLRLLPIGWRIPRRRETSDESAIAYLGPVEIRRMPAGRFVGTCVNGEPAQARETALRRLTSYLNGDNRGGAILRAERPLIQQQLGPRLWRISVRLPMVADDRIAPPPRAPKVKLWVVQPGWLAVLRMSGRPAHSAVTGGDAMVLNAIADTEWVATGSPMIRLRGSGLVQWFIGGFEVAVPVAPRCHDDPRYNADFSIVERLPVGES